MGDAALKISDEQAPNLTSHVSLAEAAAALGVHRESLSRTCRETLVARGLAIHARPPGGGQAQYWISRAYDQRLEHGRLEHAGPAPNLDPFTAAQRAAAFGRWRVVELYRQHRRERAEPIERWWPGFAAAAQRDVIEPLKARHGVTLKLTRRTVHGWHNRCQGPRDIETLIDRRGGDRKSAGEPAAWSRFEQLFLDPRQPSKYSCWERTGAWAKDQEIAWCSHKSCLRQLDARIPPEQQAYHRDRDLWRSRYAAYIEQHPERFAAGECWVGDHRPLDVLVKFEGKLIRPFITSWQDWRTRRIVGHVLTPSPDTSSILAALRAAILDPKNQGPPKRVWIDNGKDFDSFALHGLTKAQRKSGLYRAEFDEAQFGGVFGLLGIKAHFANPYGPQGKAREERTFATIAGRFDKTFATYVGRDTTRKPENLQAMLPGAPGFEHVRERLSDFIAGRNASSDHSIEDLAEDGERLSPDEAMARWRTPAVLADPGALDLCLLKWHRPVKMGRNGIRVTIGGVARRYGQFSHELRPFKGTGEPLFVAYDPADLSQLRVFDKSMRLVAVADANAHGGAHADPAREQDFKRVAADKRRYNNALKITRDLKHVEYLNAEELAARQRRLGPAASAGESPVPEAAPERSAGRNLRMVQTPLDGQSKRAQRAELRQAAGAEVCRDDEPEDLTAGGSLSDLASLVNRLGFRSMRDEPRPPESSLSELARATRDPLHDPHDDDEPLTPGTDAATPDAGRTDEYAGWDDPHPLDELT